MVYPISSINEQLRADTPAFIGAADEAYMQNIEKIALYIRDHADECPLILLSGPSGSGKTTSALKLEKKLDEMGLETHTLSMDNYFHTVEGETAELMAQGKLDLESPDRVDVPFLNAQLESIIAGCPTPLPRFDFPTHTRVDSGEVLTRKAGELVILEGIHALNPAVITVPEERTVRLYVSVRTRLETADGAVLHPQKIRLLRRLLRDTLFRGRQLTDTLQMYKSVQRGEDLYIMPYKHRSTFDIDTFIPYEGCLYRRHLLAALEELADHPEIADLLPALRELEPLEDDAVPATSLIREFIGGSIYYE